MFERTENIEAYHDVVARSLISIIEQLAKDSPTTAKKIAKFNIMQAYILYQMDSVEANVKLIDRANKSKKPIYDILAEEVRELIAKYKDKDIDEHLIDMFIYQSLAGIKPVQNTKQRARLYERVRNNLGPQ